MTDPAELAKRLRLRAARQRKTLGGLSYYSDADATSDEAAAAMLDQLASTMSEEEVVRWRPRETAPIGKYVIGYAANSPWLDSEDDPKRVVVKLQEYQRPDYQAGQRYWATFGPSRFAYEEIVAWQSLPSAPCP